MKFKSTWILLAVALGLGFYVYWYEIKGGEARKAKEEEAKKLFSVSHDKIQAITLKSPTETVTGERRGEDWAITAPLQAEGDTSEWSYVAQNLADLKKEKDLEGASGDLKSYGLDPAQLSVRFRAQAGQKGEVHFGQENPTGSYVYARLGQDRQVFLVPKYNYTGIKKSLYDLRERSLLKFNESNVRQIRLTHARGEFLLVKTSEQWHLREPLAAAADSDQIRTLFSKLSYDKVKEFVDQPQDLKALGLDRPQLRVVLTEGERTKEFMVGKEKQKGETYYARARDRSPVFLIERSTFDGLNKSLLDLRDKTIAKLERDKVDVIEITRGTKTDTLKKEKDASKMNDLLDAVLFEKVQEFPEKEPSRPEVDVKLKQGGQLLFHFGLGQEVGDRVYLHDYSASRILLVPKAPFSKFKTS